MGAIVERRHVDDLGDPVLDDKSRQIFPGADRHAWSENGAAYRRRPGRRRLIGEHEAVEACNQAPPRFRLLEDAGRRVRRRH